MAENAENVNLKPAGAFSTQSIFREIPRMFPIWTLKKHKGWCSSSPSLSPSLYFNMCTCVRTHLDLGSIMSWNNVKQLPWFSLSLFLSPSLWFPSAPLKWSHGSGSGSRRSRACRGPQLALVPVQRQCWCRRTGRPEMTPLKCAPCAQRCRRSAR